MKETRVQFNKNKEIQKKRRSKIIIAGVLVLLCILAGFIAFLRKPNFLISDIVVTGTEALDPIDIKQASEKILSGYYFWVIPKSNVFLFSKQSFSKKLQYDFPSIKGLVISFSEKTSIVINVSEKTPETVWCDSHLKCYFVDQKGVVYKESPQFSKGVYLTFYGTWVNGDISNDPIKKSFVTETNYILFRKLITALGALGTTVTTVNLDEAGDALLGISRLGGYEVGEASHIFISGSFNQDELTRSLALLLQDKGFVNALVSDGGRLESVDLRFSGKIYYKFKNGGQQTTVSPTSTAQ